jgi:hypothetical protein
MSFKVKTHIFLFISSMQTIISIIINTLSNLILILELIIESYINIILSKQWNKISLEYLR